MVDTLLENYDFSTIQKQLEQLFPNPGIDFLDMLKNVLQGKEKLNMEFLLSSLSSGIKSSMGDIKGIFIAILFLGIVSALFTNFAKIFENHQIADISYYLLYLFLITILLKTFAISYEISKETIENIVLFVKILIPVFSISLGISGGMMTAAYFYEFILLLIFGVETIFVSFLIPLIYSEVFLAIINGVTEDDKLSSMVEMIKKGIRTFLNISIGVVTGIGVLQSMVTPVLDNVKIGMAQKMVSSIPGLGNITDSVTSMVLGSAILIKNSIGVLVLILLVLLCAVPILKLFLVTFVLRGGAALIAVVSDKRMAKCTGQVGEGSALLLRTVATSLVLFLF